MKVHPLILFSVVAAITVTPAGAGEPGSWSLRMTPGILLPVADSSELFGTGGGASAAAEYRFPGSRPWFAAGGIDFQYSPISNTEDSLSILNAEAGAGLILELVPRLSLRVQGGAGYYFASIDGGGPRGSYPSLSAGLGLAFLLNPSFDLGIGAAYRNFLGLYHGLSVTLYSAYFLSGRDARRIRIESSLPLRPELLVGAKPDRPGFGIDLERIELDEVFPVFKSYYGDRPLGRAVLVNKESVPISEIRLSFFAKQYMDAPKECGAPASLGPGQSIAVDLTALFTDRILEVTEGTKATAEVVLEYRLGEELYRDARNVTVRLLDRNAMRWEDDRRAAAFVTAKDPRVLAFAKNAAGLVRDKGPAAFDENLLYGMGIFKALDLYGLSYVVDPKTPFADYSANSKAVDYLQFPRQTLEYRAGDCDDLSILYAALLESVGIETAFVTVPGHIFVAFELDTPAADLARTFSSVQDLIVREGRAWVPVEVTVRRDGFLRAWAEGARQWRDASGKSTAGFLPVHEAWKEYEPVGLPGASADVSLPPPDRLLAAFLEEAGRLVDRELGPRAVRLEEEIRSSGGSPSSHNRLGVLYARFGDLDKAEKSFDRALAKGDFAPALTNLGNLHFLRRDYPKAQALYERAARLAPDNPAVVVNLARVYYEQEKFDLARKNHEKLTRLDPALAARYAYLGSGSTDARAGAPGLSRGSVVWRDE